MIGKGSNYLDSPLHAMTEFFKTRIENVEIPIPLSVPLRNNSKNKKCSKKRTVVTFDDFEDKDSGEEHSGKKFCQYHGTCGHNTDQCTTLKALIT